MEGVMGTIGMMDSNKELEFGFEVTSKKENVTSRCKFLES